MYTLSALYVHCHFLLFWVFGFLAMFVHIRQGVREQPDTGYWKSLPPYFATPALLRCWGDEWEEVDFYASKLDGLLRDLEKKYGDDELLREPVYSNFFLTYETTCSSLMI